MIKDTDLKLLSERIENIRTKFPYINIKVDTTTYNIIELFYFDGIHIVSSKVTFELLIYCKDEIELIHCENLRANNSFKKIYAGEMK